MSRFAAQKKEYISVSRLTALLKQTLEKQIGEVCFEGEISEIKQAASGHIYFTLKDDQSQVQAVMWKGMNGGLSFSPKAGLQVLCHGIPSVWNVTGRLQIVVHYMVLAGEGLLQKKFLELKDRLEKEGLFSQARKRPIPFLPSAIGIVTSKSGAVIHDIMVKITERMPIVKTYLVDVRVQGEGASAEIAAAIQYYNTKKNVDVIIVARGGGSLEDLWAFNEERTVRAIFGSEIPVVCGVGHEVDITLADLAADMRAPTPTAAAEAVVPKRSDLLNIINDLENRLYDFQSWLSPLVQHVDELAFKLNANFEIYLQKGRIKLQALQSKVELLRPDKILALLNSKLTSLESGLRTALRRAVDSGSQRVQIQELRYLNTMQGLLTRSNHKLATLEARLEGVSPRKVLARGYSITEFNGRVVTSAKTLSTGDTVKVTLHEGEIDAKVEKPY